MTNLIIGNTHITDKEMAKIHAELVQVLKNHTSSLSVAKYVIDQLDLDEFAEL